MKTRFTWNCLTRSLLLSLVLWGLAGAAVSLAAPTISVTPNTITSTTQTDVQVTISGLANGGIIRLEKWIDTNQNGYQDPSDILWTRKRLQDGEHPANASSQGDEDGIANGQIVTTFNYHAQGFNNFPGSYLFRVDDNGLFDDAAFVITPTTTGQSVSGSVKVGSVPVPGAYVFLWDPVRDLEMLGSITDAQGNYTVNIPDNLVEIAYEIGAFSHQPSIYSNFADGAAQSLNTISLGENQTGVNLTLKNDASLHITGTVLRKDRVAPNNAMGRTWVSAESENVSQDALTEIDGTFDLFVPPGTYEIAVWSDDPQSPPLSYGMVGYDDYTKRVVAPAINQTIEIPGYGYDLHTGRVLDIDGNPVAGFRLQAFDWQATYTPTNGAFSDGEGNFTLATRNTGNDWYVDASWDMDNLVNYEYISKHLSIDSTAGSTSGNDLIVQKHTAWMTGAATFAGGAPAIDEWISATSAYGFHSGDSVEAEDGSFFFPVAVGEWQFYASPHEFCPQAVFVEEDQESVEVNMVVDVDTGTCDLDLDNDGVQINPDIGEWDNCQSTPNPSQADVDSNGIGDACDIGDYDNDGLADYKEVRIGSSVNNEDTDGDGWLDGVDPNPMLWERIFTDVPADYWAKAAIDEFVTMGISNGCGNDQFCPDAPVTRAQMAVFMTKALGESPAASCSGSMFTDVSIDSVGSGFCVYIEAFSDLGITSGCGGGAYCPEDTVTRSQMAVFMTKALEESPAASCSGSKFTDVNSDSVGSGFCRYIEAFSDLGITSGCGNGQYCPDSVVTRAQMAVFMTRAF